MIEEGGGASRSTDPAAGTSAATDVSLREYLGSRLDALDRHVTNEIASLRRESELANANSEKAIKVAADEAKERLIAHNGLIEQMRTQATHFVPRESWEERNKMVDGHFARFDAFQSKLVGGIIIIGAIGLTNLAKLWFS